MMITSSFIDYCYHQHDVICNQKYGGGKGLPFSYHLKMVMANVNRFEHLLPPKGILVARMIAAGHDLIEDARVSYNEIVSMAGKEVAEGIFLCTEMRGRTRTERKSDQFYEEMKVNDLAVYVKLCDIAANTMHSVAERSSMLKNAKAEWPKIKEHLYREDYRPIFEYIELLHNLAV